MAGEPICDFCRRPMVLLEFVKTSTGLVICEDCGLRCVVCGEVCDGEACESCEEIYWMHLYGFRELFDHDSSSPEPALSGAEGGEGVRG